jgi:hypothetical protein
VAAGFALADAAGVGVGVALEEAATDADGGGAVVSGPACANDVRANVSARHAKRTAKTTRQGW